MVPQMNNYRKFVSFSFKECFYCFKQLSAGQTTEKFMTLQLVKCIMNLMVVCPKRVPKKGSLSICNGIGSICQKVLIYHCWYAIKQGCTSCNAMPCGNRKLISCGRFTALSYIYSKIQYPLPVSTAMDAKKNIQVSAQSELLIGYQK